ncbi:type I restriction endonuclease subunit R [Cupriavidus sp. AU9028]|uniref:type I restriction endonuclease subunit R n=1 Tax=Cupriavidus sp. AU9028 TaxID=2871157 RepID=UPI001C98B44A|nr:HsdR family type I site-specific deoxyribonuclease [Cupriavidus sp. AU9028]MBY4897225.1 HsdR family type I site-specific deoxyribonuclease [Cupriavidus sp. AU9028]
MSEAGYVELPILQWLSGHGSATPGDKGLGWTYRDEPAMADFNRPLADPLVEELLIAAILRINDHVTTPEQAKLAVKALRTTMDAPDRLTANRETLDRLRDGASVELVPGEGARTVHFIAFEPERQHLNDYTATNQYRVQGVKQCKADTVLLVNGIPLVVAEYKSITASGAEWPEAVRQLHRYQRQAPQMLVPNVFCVAADEDTFRYGTVLFHDATKDDIERHLDTWGPWLSRYPDVKGWWNEPEADNPDDPLERPVKALLRLKPAQVLDFLQHFTVFETKKGKTVKKVARYQQFEAVNDIVDRCLGLIGKSVSAQDRTGLIWHTQGSGKSLTMVFAAYKLRRQAVLTNPTVLIVVDRRDLKTQISDDFDACDFPNVRKAMGVQDLKAILKQRERGTFVTTVQSFQQMGDLAPLDDDNIITLVDEAHRSQKGATAESYAMTMRVKLPNAFRFGLTGTPIDRTMTNTHRDFGPVVDGQQERYLSYYGIKRAIKDGATLEVHYQRDRVPFIVDEKTLNVGFEDMCKEMEVEDEEAKDLIQRQRSQWKELARHPDRVEIVVGKVLEHFLTYPDPNGFKAQLVGVDRTACARFKDALDAKLKEKGLPPDWCDVIISEGQNDDPDLARFHYGKQKQDELIDYFKLTPKQWEDYNREAFGEDTGKWRPPLKILIVCDRLLTGFDAPIEQVMYLDKPLRDHNLLQAIARTNRPLPAMNKRTGVVVDYFGVFSNLAKALNFDENIREEALIDWDKLRATVPGEVARCMESFKGITIADTRECLLAALRAIKDPDAAKIFEHNFKSLERLWEAVSPDPVLYEHRYTYNWLCSVYIAHRRRQCGAAQRTTFGELSVKTRELIEQNTTFMEIADSLPVFKIDKDYVSKLEELPTPADKAAALEAILTAELAEDDGSGFTYRHLGERLARLKAQKDAADKAAEKRLKELQDIADEKAKADEEPARLGLTQPGEYGVFTVLREYSANEDESYLADCARRMVAHLRGNRLLAVGWSNSRGGRMRVEQSLLAESWNPAYAGLGFDADDANPPFLAHAVDELVNSDGLG